MRRFIKMAILSPCVIAVTTLSVAMLKGEVPGRPRKTPKRSASVSPPPPRSPIAAVAPPMGTPEPGSPEAERMANFQARVRAGLVPTVHIGLPPGIRPVKARKTIPDFVPTQIVPQKGASGEMLAFQQKLSPAFAANDPMPASRADHFGWLRAHPNVRIYGWYGTVTGAEVQGDSSVIVAIEFHAKTDIKGMRAFVRDYVTEKYLVANGNLQLLDTDAALTDLAKQVVQSF